MQQFVREGMVRITKVKGKVDPPDFGTKYLSREDMTRLLRLMDVKFPSFTGVVLLQGADAKKDAGVSENEQDDNKQVMLCRRRTTTRS